MSPCPERQGPGTAGNLLVASYDDLGRKTSVQDPDRGIWTYAWDGLGRLESQTDARSNVISYQYDAIGRLVQRLVKKPGDPSAVLESSWQYDVNNKLGVLGTIAAEAARIQNAASRIQEPVHVVGSRAAGTPRPDSDWDFVINANHHTRNGAASSLPGAKSVQDGLQRNQDVFKGPLDPSKPHVTFYPEPR